MLIKVSMLIAIGDVDVDTFTSVEVKVKHVKQALDIIERWKIGSSKLLNKIGVSHFEDAIMKIHVKLKSEGKLSRSYISRAFKISKRSLDEIQFTMLDRGLITLEGITLNGSQKPTLYWINNDEKSKDAKVQ